MTGSPQQIERGFGEAFETIERRIDLFLSLPFSALDSTALKRELDRIGTQS